MTNHQLIEILTSKNDAQLEQAIVYLAQQKQIPQDLLTEYFVAWQLVIDKKTKKKLTDLLKKYTPSTFQVFLRNKYNFNQTILPKKMKEIFEEITKSGLIDLQKLTFYLFPFFPENLWLQMQEMIDPTLKKHMLAHPQFLTYTTLTLAALGFEELPQELAAFQNLEDLNLRHNLLTNADFSVLPKLKRLKTLYLYNCKLKNIPVAFLECTQLETLCFSWCNLSKADFSPLASFKNLKTLDLSKCNLQSFPKILGEFIALEYLHADYNPLTQEDFSSLKNLSNLRFLSVWDLRIDKDEEERSVYELLHHTKKIEFYHYQMKQIPIAWREFLALETIIFDGIPIEKADFGVLAPLQNLKELVIWNTKLKALPIGIEKLTYLEGLYLDNNPLAEADFSPLLKLKNLKELELKGCGLKNLSPALIALQNKGVALKW